MLSLIKQICHAGLDKPSVEAHRNGTWHVRNFVLLTTPTTPLSPCTHRRRFAAQLMAMEVVPQRKRRRVVTDSSAPAAVPEHHRKADDSASEESAHADAVSEHEDAELPSSEDADAEEGGQAEAQRLPKQLQKLQRLKQAYEQRGVVYISRIPPHMVRVGRNPPIRSDSVTGIGIAIHSSRCDKDPALLTNCEPLHPPEVRRTSQRATACQAHTWAQCMGAISILRLSSFRRPGETAQKPAKLRHMLGQHGELGRVYLVPEDPLARKRRKQAGRNSGKNFTEGWVEFEDKRVAKQVLADVPERPVSLPCPTIPQATPAHTHAQCSTT